MIVRVWSIFCFWRQMLQCRICKKEIHEKFGGHLNTHHKTNLTEYFEKNPDQKEEYEKMKKPHWAKGLTKETDPRVALIAMKQKEYCNDPEIKQERSERLKNLYEERGDILTPKQRAKAVKSGNDGWIKKLDSMTPEEIKSKLKSFTDAGNEAQRRLRETRNPSTMTSEEWMKKYPFGLGVAVKETCENCGEIYFRWEGGKPRPIKKLCSEKCKKEFRKKNPNISHRQWYKKIMYQSSKCEYEFYLDSNLELALAIHFDKIDEIKKWIHCPMAIPYVWNNKNRNYYPDFLINDKHLVEVKSSYIKNSQPEFNAKMTAALLYSSQNNLAFHYIEFKNEKDYNNESIAKNESIKLLYQ